MRSLETGGFSILTLALVVATSLVAAPTRGEAAPPTKEEIAQEKKEIRQKSKEILAQLYKAQPNAKTSINKAAGYAVFSNFGMKIFVAGSGKGKGVAVDKQDQEGSVHGHARAPGRPRPGRQEIQSGLGLETPKLSRRS